MKKLFYILPLLALAFAWQYWVITRTEPVDRQETTQTSEMSEKPATGHSTLAKASSQGLPDPVLTPGALNPAINQSNIKTTVCVPGYSKKIRPPVSWTAPREKQSIKDYGYPYPDPGWYEYDHFIPISLGGAPKDEKNLWAQPYGNSYYDLPSNDILRATSTITKYGAHAKDRVELYLYREMCAGRITLKEAQAMMYRWESVYDTLHRETRALGGPFGGIVILPDEEAFDPDDL